MTEAQAAEKKWLYPESIFLIYGAGGAGKSTLLAQLAAHTHKTYGKKTRIIGADGGGTKAFQPLIRRGIVEYWPVDLWEKDIWTTLGRAAKGWWPSKLDTPNSPLLPPDKAGLGEIGAMGFESVTAWGRNLMTRLQDVDNPANLHIVKDGDSEARIAVSALNHYGMAQDYLARYIGYTRRLPVFAVAWTALELRGGDDGYGKPIYGPAFPGKKITALCVPWFTDVLHLELEPEEKRADGTQKVNRKLYLDDHYPADTKPYGFKAKCSVGGMPQSIAAPEGQNTISRYFELAEDAYAKSEKLLLGD